MPKAEPKPVTYRYDIHPPKYEVDGQLYDTEEEARSAASGKTKPKPQED